ncbi:Factor arrest protein 10 [Meyerozyma sp. JA9]|nr:Factor arrest protein 10 [Meyerozyma sp. JA9]
MSDIALQLDVSEPRKRSRPRSDSQSHHSLVVETPPRKPAVYFVTLSSLNDTFVKKHLSVPYYPETRKLGRPAGAKIKPDATNGYFDSRVLSRSHAAMYMDASGKLMLKDLGSSNGTYVNDERIGSEPVEIHIGDNIHLGFNIQADTNHKQISARVDNVSVMSNFLSSSVPEVGQYTYVQNVLDKLRGKEPSEAVTVDSPLFADMGTVEAPANAGAENVGMYKNSNLVTAPAVSAAARTLAVAVATLKQHNNTLLSVEQFLTKYKENVDIVVAKSVEHKVAQEVAQVVADKLRRAEQKAHKERVREQQLYENLIGEFELYRDEKEARIRQLESDIVDLRTAPQSPDKHALVRELTPDSDPDNDAENLNDVSIHSILASPPHENHSSGDEKTLVETHTKSRAPTNAPVNVTFAIVALLLGMALQRAFH